MVKRVTRSFSFSDEDQLKRFVDYAKKCGMLPSDLVQSIADGKLKLRRTEHSDTGLIKQELLSLLEILYRDCGYSDIQSFLLDLSNREKVIIDNSVVPQLLQAVWTLRDTGQDAAAGSIAHILLERFNISDSVKEQLESLLSRINVPIASTLREYINNKQPFILDYRSGSGNIHKYTVQYAELGSFPGERRNYLKCWVDEVNKHAEISELAHNYTLSLNRILGVNPASFFEWRHEGLDKILIEFVLSGSWVKSYESKIGDITPEPPTVDGKLYVSRYVTFWHFFKREIIRYGAGCKVVAPIRAIELMRDEIQKMLANY